MSNETPAEVLAAIERSMTAASPSELPERWRQDAKVHREKGNIPGFVAGLDWCANELERSLAAGKGDPVAWQINATESYRGWETCTKECYDETLRTGRYMGLPTGTMDVIVRALYTAPPADPAKASDTQDVRWMDEACNLLSEAGHGIHAAALGTLAHAIRIGRVADVAKASGSSPSKLAEIVRVLDRTLGDTDPYFGDDTTDDDIRDEAPVWWAVRELRALLATTPASAPEVTEEMVERAEAARVRTLNALTSYGSAGVDERYNKAIRAALTAALQEGKSHG